MSHIVAVAVQFTDEDALRAGVERLGGTWHDKTTHKTYGGATGRCHQAASFPGAAFEIGIVRGGDGKLTIAWDPWPSGGLKQVLGEGASRLVQAYGIEKARKTVKKMGHVVVREVQLANGGVKLVTAAR